MTLIASATCHILCITCQSAWHSMNALSCMGNTTPRNHDGSIGSIVPFLAAIVYCPCLRERRWMMIPRWRFCTSLLKKCMIVWKSIELQRCSRPSCGRSCLSYYPAVFINYHDHHRNCFGLFMLKGLLLAVTSAATNNNSGVLRSTTLLEYCSTWNQRNARMLIWATMRVRNFERNCFCVVTKP